MKKRSILSSPRIEELKRKKRRILRNKIIFFFICFLLILTGLVFLSRWKELNIENIQISGNKIIENQQIESIVKENIDEYYLGLFPKTNFLILPKKHIKNELSNKFKRLKDISINDKNIKTLEIIVSEREGKYTYCGILSIENNSEEKCYFIDNDGYIFDEAPYFSGNVYFKFYGKNDSAIENPSGTYFLKDKFVEITTFRDALEKFKLNPTAFYINSEEDANISLSSDIINGPKIIFKLDSDYQKLAENLQSAITTEPLQNELKNKLSSLLYVDLRFGNKVYYKFR